MRIAVVGATGVLGRHLVPRLVERGHFVRATVRRDRDGARMTALDAEPVAADILDAASLAAAVAGCDGAVHAATSIPTPGGKGDWALNDRIRREGTANLLAACQAAGVVRYVQQSIAMLHAGNDLAAQDETCPIAPYERIRSAAEMEALVRASGRDWRIVRGGAFYGPGTGREEQWLAALRAGALKLPGDGAAYISLIHVADMASAMVAAIEAEAPRSAFIAADSEPVTYRTLFAYLAMREGLPTPPPGGPPLLPSFRVSNAKLKQLGWRPAFASYRSGLAA
jgi:nucleoside-diphosphate-sugar epimerase